MFSFSFFSLNTCIYYWTLEINFNLFYKAWSSLVYYFTLLSISVLSELTKLLGLTLLFLASELFVVLPRCLPTPKCWLVLSSESEMVVTWGILILHPVISHLPGDYCALTLVEIAGFTLGFQSFQLSPCESPSTGLQRMQQGNTGLKSLRDGAWGLLCPLSSILFLQLL